MGEAQQQRTTCRLASGAFMVRDYDKAVEIGRMAKQVSMAKAWPEMLKLTAKGDAVFVTEGGATLEVLEQRHADIGDGEFERLVRVRFVDATDANLDGEFWLASKALENCPAV